MKKNIIFLVALLFASATFVACSNEDNAIENPLQPGGKTYTLTIEASKGDDAANSPARRALSLSGKTLNATWAEGERVTVYNVTQSAELGGYLEAQSSGASTTLKGTLTGTIQNGDELKLKFLSDNYNGQNGTLEYIASHCDYAEATVEVSAVSDGKITTTGTASFVNQQAIVKFTLKKKADNSNLAVTSLTVNDGTNDYTVTPTSATNELFVAIPATSNVNLRTLIDGDGYGYYKKGAGLTAGQYYEITVKMTHQYVDLGLTSGIKWAIYNLSESGFVSSPEEFGDYYAWGETEPYYSSLDPLTWKDGKGEGYSWSSYTLCNDGNSYKLTKYNTDNSYGTVDDKTQLDLSDDVAYQKQGGKWRIPTDAEWKELKDNCTWTWTSLNGVNGCNITGPNSKSIFLPAAGYWSGTYFGSSSGYYYSSSLYYSDYNSSYIPSMAGNVNFYYSDYTHNCYIYWSSIGRNSGLSVRPVTE